MQIALSENRWSWAVSLISGLALWAVCTVSHAEEAVLSDSAYGKIRFGEKLEVAKKLLGEPVPPATDLDEQQCRQIVFKAYPDVYFMVEQGTITRAESVKPIATAIGFTVGSSLAEVQKKYPQAVLKPHAYTDGHYVILTSKDEKSALLMEENEGKIMVIRGGLVPSVNYIEGCL
ncbi:MAG: hypothetical protein LBE24_08810 [Methylobacillus sp.]|nr:hypothetical protein [Methylobacillus sp.]